MPVPAWIPLALLFPALTGTVNILDKLIVDRYSPTAHSYAFWIGVWELVTGAIVIGIIGIASDQGLESRSFLGGMLTGVVSASSLLLYLVALTRGQVARVVPIWFLHPLMVVPMAAGFLDERLPTLALVAIFPAVLGAVLVSWQKGEDSRVFGDPAVVLLALAAAVALAVSFVLSKYFLEGGFSWLFLGSYRLGFAVAMLWVTVLPGVRRTALGMGRNRGFMGLVALAEGIVTVVLIVRFAAVILGPVSLVTAVSSVQPGLVFLYSLGLATLSPAYFGSWISRGTLRPQMAGIAAITAGVVIISLQTIDR